MKDLIFSSILEAKHYMDAREDMISFRIKGDYLVDARTGFSILLSAVKLLVSLKIEAGPDFDHECFLHLIETAGGKKGYFIDVSGLDLEPDFLDDHVIW
jgi:hypothetical protein